jgi:hypothetical protein
MIRRVTTPKGGDRAHAGNHQGGKAPPQERLVPGRRILEWIVALAALWGAVSGTLAWTESRNVSVDLAATPSAMWRA